MSKYIDISSLPKPHRGAVYGEAAQANPDGLAEHDADGHAKKVGDGQGDKVEADPDGLPARERQ